MIFNRQQIEGKELIPFSIVSIQISFSMAALFPGIKHILNGAFRRTSSLTLNE